MSEKQTGACTYRRCYRSSSKSTKGRGGVVHRRVEHRGTNHLMKGEIPCGRVMALGGATGEPVSRLALEEPSLFCIRCPCDKKKERDRGEERPKKRRAPAPSASLVSFKSDKCAVGNMTEKNNAEGEGERVAEGAKEKRNGRRGSPIGAREIEKLISAPGGRLFRIVSDARLPGGCLWRD